MVERRNSYCSIPPFDRTIERCPSMQARSPRSLRKRNHPISLHLMAFADLRFSWCLHTISSTSTAVPERRSTSGRALFVTHSGAESTSSSLSVVSVLSYRYFESPFLHLKTHFEYLTLPTTPELADTTEPALLP